MKTIQIPTTSNPFIVNINNNAYQYRAGETAEVPDEVAEAIEDALELEPKPKRYLNKLAQIASKTIEQVTVDDLAGVKEIPSSVTAIGYQAFLNCTNLERIRLYSKTPPTIQGGVFSGASKTCRYEVPPDSVEAYKAAEYWSTLASWIYAMEK